jgi:hypothetical protein
MWSCVSSCWQMGAVVGGSRSRDVALGIGGEMAMDESGDESCHVWISFWQLGRLPD